jgi:hypothetical protein
MLPSATGNADDVSLWDAAVQIAPHLSRAHDMKLAAVYAGSASLGALTTGSHTWSLCQSGFPQAVGKYRKVLGAADREPIRNI